MSEEQVDEVAKQVSNLNTLIIISVIVAIATTAIIIATTTIIMITIKMTEEQVDEMAKQVGILTKSQLHIFTTWQLASPSQPSRPPSRQSSLRTLARWCGRQSASQRGWNPRIVVILISIWLCSR